jgi:dolichol kinase
MHAKFKHRPPKYELRIARANVEFHRKSLHLIGLAVPAIYLLAGRALPVILVALTLASFSIFEIYRLRHGIPSKKVTTLVGPMMRPHENHKVAAHIYFIAGVFIALVAFPKEIAIAVILVSILADGAAALVGKMLKGQHWFSTKCSWEGTGVFFLVALPITSLIMGPLIGFIGALAATLVQMLPANDNLWIPIVAGLVMLCLSVFV